MTHPYVQQLLDKDEHRRLTKAVEHDRLVQLATEPAIQYFVFREMSRMLNRWLDNRRKNKASKQVKQHKVVMP